MGKQRKTKLVDFNTLAADIVRQVADKPTPTKRVYEKNPAAVALGRLGGAKGGRARADSLTEERRKEIAQIAARARWKTGG